MHMFDVILAIKQDKHNAENNPWGVVEVTQGRSEESSECLLDPFCFEEEKRKFEGVIHHLLETHP